MRTTVHPSRAERRMCAGAAHASAFARDADENGCIAAENVVALFAGKRPPNILNPEVLKAT